MISPAKLRPNDKVAIISTARKVTPAELEIAVQHLQNWGLQVEFGPNLFQEENQFAGSDAQRLADLQWAIDHPELKAVFFARGGYGTTRIIDDADFSGLEKFPKWLVGFSDITALHCHANKLGFETIHAAMPFQFGKEGIGDALQSLKNVLFEDKILYEVAPHSFNKAEVATGKVIGGNLSILSHIIGTKSDIDTTDCILFLEDLDEYLYHIDRLLVHLKRCGKLDNLAGLIIGHMSDMKDNTVPFGKQAYEIIQHHIEKFDYPVCFDFPVGHEVQNMALICGREATLTVGEEKVSLAY